MRPILPSDPAYEGLQVLRNARALVAGTLHGLQLPGKPNLIYLKDSLWNKKTYLWRHNYPYD